MSSRVPTAPVLRVVERLMVQDGIEDLGHLSVRTGIDQSTLTRIPERETMEFDTADLIFCKLGEPLIWREPELADIYLNVDLSCYELRWPAPATRPKNLKRCACPGCSNEFEVIRKRGLSRRRYCSKMCTQKASRIRRGIQRRVNDSREFVCRHGHERTPENTELLSNGTRRCRICNRERTQEFRARRRTACLVA